MEAKTLRMMYFALFHSVINYGIIILAWSGADSNSLNWLQNYKKKHLYCFIQIVVIFLWLN